MTDIGAIGGQIGVQVATQALKLAQQKQQAPAALVEQATHEVESAQEDGKGDEIDVRA